MCPRFGILCLFHLHRQVGKKYTSYLPAYEGGTECSETSAYKIQTPGNYSEESIQHIFVRSTAVAVEPTQPSFQCEPGKGVPRN